MRFSSVYGKLTTFFVSRCYSSRRVRWMISTPPDSAYYSAVKAPPFLPSSTKATSRSACQKERHSSPRNPFNVKRLSKSIAVISEARLRIPTSSSSAVVQEIHIINTNERLKRKLDSFGIK